MENVTDAVLVDIPSLVDYMAKLRSSELIDSARRLLNRDSEPTIRAKAIAAWLRAEEFSSGDILSAVRRLNPPSGERLAYARQMWLHGVVEPACRLAGEVLSAPVATSEQLLQALIIIIRAGGRAEAFRGVELLRNNSRCTPSERAWIAAELGALDERGLAVDLWLDALVATDLSIEERVRAAEELRLVGAADEASSRIGIAVQRPNLVAAEADRLKRLHAWMI